MSFWANNAKIAIGLRIPLNLPEASILRMGKYPTTIAAPIT
jgi:hypothetical protein